MARAVNSVARPRFPAESSFKWSGNQNRFFLFKVPLFFDSLLHGKTSAVVLLFPRRPTVPSFFTGFFIGRPSVALLSIHPFGGPGHAVDAV